MTSVPRAGTTLHVRCRFLARYAELAGAEELDVTLPLGATVAAAVDAVRERIEAGALPARPLVAVNQEHAAYDRRLNDGDELAFLPPLAGG